MGEFKRYDGYIMHVPQQFIDSHLPTCPFCHTDRPHWLLDSRMELSWTGTRTFYRCEQCGATLSSTAADAAQKGTKQPSDSVTYLRLDELGTVCADEALLGRQQPITFYQQLANPAAVAVTADAPETVPQPEAADAPAKVWGVFALIGMILGIAGMCVMLIPYLNSALVMVPVAGIVFSALGKRSDSGRKANTGLILSIVSTVMCIIMSGVYTAILK
jgi:hypothetical protein